MLSALAPPGSLLDIRHRTADKRFGRLFLHARDERAAYRIVSLGQRTDVYVGCAARLRPRGTRENIAATALLWADCDNRRSLQAARVFTPSPSMIVASGSPGHGHAYWALTEPLDLDATEHTNRRLAQTLGADVRCADATRILRPPGTFNHKHDPPTPVELLQTSEPHDLACHVALRHDPADILAALSSRNPTPNRQRLPARESDPLHRIAPTHYVRLLTGRTPNREGKIACPFHEDRTPSLHAYKNPERGWSCFGCLTPDGKPLGGDIYTLASLLWNIPAHGRAFLELQARLDDVFAIRRDRSPLPPATRNFENTLDLASAIER
jgi:hypothetical protein